MALLIFLAAAAWAWVITAGAGSARHEIVIIVVALFSMRRRTSGHGFEAERSSSFVSRIKSSPKRVKIAEAER
jgi:hypothetical protein